MKGTLSHWATAFALVAVWGALSVFALSSTSEANAAPKPGLWQENVITVDGVTVRKIRDTTGGDYNVCYLATRFPSSPTNGYPPEATPTIAFSCVPEKP